MKQERTILVLAIIVAALAGLGFSPAGSLAPRELNAQANCGAFNGKECNSKCNRECSNGSCCDWSRYYYLNAEEAPVNP